MTDRYLSPRDVAVQLSISQRDAYRVIRNLPRVRLGRRIRVAAHDLAAYLETKTERPQWEASIDRGPPGRGKGTGQALMASATESASEPATRKSRENGSVNMSWLRPLRPAGGSKGSRKRSAT